MNNGTPSVKKKRMIKLNFRFLQRLPAREKKMTLSTFFTLMRMALTPFIVHAMVMEKWGMAFTLFATAAVTDILDGNIARWRKEQTLLGACLDPLADKILILSCFCTLACIQSPLFTMPKWFFGIVLVKELMQIGGALSIYFYKGHIEVRPRKLGKFTTLVQMLFISWLFACYFFAWVPMKTYYTMLGIVLLLVIASFIQYSYMGVRWLHEDIRRYS